MALRFYACGAFYQVIRKSTISSLLHRVSSALITNCVVRWPGSMHDARILRESNIFQIFQQNPPEGIILGDSAYPLLPWLMTPFATARFNSAHGTTRSTIEHLNGVLKRRCACLNYLRVEPQRACNIIFACTVLHNISQTRTVPLHDDSDDLPQPQVDGPVTPLAALQLNGPAGRSMRDALVNLYY
ncbi:HARB1 nuclease, partial [Amia calva]|nr:HARB1 nuclease [Amia calva]